MVCGDYGADVKRPLTILKGKQDAGDYITMLMEHLLPEAPLHCQCSVDFPTGQCTRSHYKSHKGILCHMANEDFRVACT